MIDLRLLTSILLLLLAVVLAAANSEVDRGFLREVSVLSCRARLRFLSSARERGRDAHAVIRTSRQEISTVKEDVPEPNVFCIFVLQRNTQATKDATSIEDDGSPHHYFVSFTRLIQRFSVPITS